MPSIEWYFDFISPFAYLQLERLQEFAPYGAIHYQPVLFAGLLKHWGHKGPAELPGKRRFSYRHIQWQAQRHGIAFKMPPAHPFNPLPLLRLTLALDCQPAVVQQIFRFVWRHGRDPSDPTEQAALLAELGCSEADLEHSDTKSPLRQNTEHAATQGIFGVPTLFIDGEIFWGFDATDMALDYLRDPALFDSPEMRRVSDLPVGVQRST